MARNISKYQEVKFDFINFLNSGKLVDLSGRQDSIEVDLKDLGLVNEDIGR